MGIFDAVRRLAFLPALGDSPAGSRPPSAEQRWVQQPSTTKAEVGLARSLPMATAAALPSR